MLIIHDKIQKERLRLMEFKQLESYIAIVKYKNLTTAAEALGISQPTISIHLKNLEEVAPKAYRRSSEGSEKAAVLPVPVLAAAMRSRPSSARGMACSWTGVGAS